MCQAIDSTILAVSKTAFAYCTYIVVKETFIGIRKGFCLFSCGHCGFISCGSEQQLTVINAPQSSPLKGQTAHVRPNVLTCSPSHSSAITHTHRGTHAKSELCAPCTCTLFLSYIGCCFPVCHSYGALLGAAGNRRPFFFCIFFL